MSHPAIWVGDSVGLGIYGATYGGGFAYPGTRQDPCNVFKINPATMLSVATWTGESGEHQITCMEYRVEGGVAYIYAGLDTIPGKVIKIDVATMQTVLRWTGASDQQRVNGLCFDATYLYVSIWGLYDYSSIAKVVKVNPTTMVTADSPAVWTGAAGQLNGGHLEWDGTYIYDPLYTTPAQVVKINPATMATVSTWVGGTNENKGYGICYDGTYLYAGTGDQSYVAKVLKINTSTMSTIATWTGASGEVAVNWLTYAGGYIYAPLELVGSPGKVIKIDPSTMATVDTWIGADTSEANIDVLPSDGTYLYGGTTPPPTAVKLIKIDPSTMETATIEDVVDTAFQTNAFQHNAFQIKAIIYQSLAGALTSAGILGKMTSKAMGVTEGTEEQTQANSYIVLYNGGSNREGHRLTITNKGITSLSFKLRRDGSPTGDITFTIRAVSDDHVINSKIWGDASTIPTSAIWEKATFAVPVTVNEEVRISTEFSGGSSGNGIAVLIYSGDVVAGYETEYHLGSWIDDPNQDCAFRYTYLSDGVNFSGILATIHSKFLSISGALTPTGALVRLPKKLLAGTISSAGTLSKTISKIVGQGYAYFSGTVSRIISKSLGGALASAGALGAIRWMVKSISGTLTSSGALSKFSTKVLNGVIAPTGASLKSTYKALAGTISSAGESIRAKTTLQAIGGTLTFAGAVATSIITATLVSVGGALVLAGDVAKATYKDISGALTSTGELVKKTTLVLAGFVSSITGSLGKITYKSVVGVLTSSSILDAVWSTGEAIKVALAGVLTSAGTVNKYTKRLLDGTLTFSGALRKMTSKFVSGVMSFIGILGGVPAGVPLEITLSFSEDLDIELSFEPDLDIDIDITGG